MRSDKHNPLKKNKEPIELIFGHLVTVKNKCGSFEYFLRHCVVSGDNDSEFDFSKEEICYVNKYITNLKKELSDLDKLMKRAVKKYKD